MLKLICTNEWRRDVMKITNVRINGFVEEINKFCTRKKKEIILLRRISKMNGKNHRE